MQHVQLPDDEVLLTETEAHLTAELQLVRAELDHAQQRLLSLLNSTSWKITIPIRNVVMNARRAAKLARLAAADPGSVIRAARVFRQMGIDGLKTAVVRYANRQNGMRSYSRWIAEFDTITANDRAVIQKHIETFAARPLISVIVPVYNPNAAHLRILLDSVLAQIYPHWELCIADDASTGARVRTVLDSYASRDSRIKVVYRMTKGHISAASNSALKVAGGEFIALLDHDDVIPPHALYMMVEAINRFPNSDMFYSDEDKLDAAGRRVDPYFKSDWNPELIYGQNFVGNFGVYRTALVQNIGGFRIGYEGSPVYDLVLRLLNATRFGVIHVPHVLHHGRIHDGPSTFSSSQGDSASTTARKVIVEHFAAKGERVDAINSAAGHFHRVIRAKPTKWPKVSAIVPTRDHVDDLRTCIDGLLDKTDYPNLEIIIANNESRRASTLKFFDEVKARGVRVIDAPGPFNFSKINNDAVANCSGEIILFLNNDIAMRGSAWLKEMVIYTIQPDIGAVGARLLYPDGTLQHGGVVLGLGGVAGHFQCGVDGGDPGYFGHLKLARDVSCVTAACMVMPRPVFETVGGFNATDLKVAYNDVDLCMRIREAGYRIIWTPHAELDHFESKSRGRDTDPKSRLRFEREVAYMQRRWGETLQKDPFFSLNLSLTSVQPACAMPPRVDKPWLAFAGPAAMANGARSRAVPGR